MSQSQMHSSSTTTHPAWASLYHWRSFVLNLQGSNNSWKLAGQPRYFPAPSSSGDSGEGALSTWEIRERWRNRDMFSAKVRFLHKCIHLTIGCKAEVWRLAVLPSGWSHGHVVVEKSVTWNMLLRMCVEDAVTASGTFLHTFLAEYKHFSCNITVWGKCPVFTNPVT